MDHTKYRHELKYIVSNAQLAVIRSRISGIMKQDKNVVEKGFYNISSLYFDDYYHRCYYENENGVDPREKFRIRIYNHSAERISLELKRKERGKTLKRSCRITREAAESLMKMQGPELSRGDLERTAVISGDASVLRKLILEQKEHGMKPSVIVEYDRVPFVYKNGNVRVTFDMNIASSAYTSRFFEPEYPKRQVMPVGKSILEVKYDEYLPDFIYHALQIDNLQNTAFSKFYICSRLSSTGDIIR